MEGSSLRSILQEKTWLPKKEKTSSTLAQEGIILEKTLGEGAYAKVKSAYYEKLKKKVAVKIISKHKVPKDFVSKFLIREITMMAELDHPNIVSFSSFMVECLCLTFDAEQFLKKHNLYAHRLRLL